MKKLKRNGFIFISFLFLYLPFFYGCISTAASAEEYYSIGMAYFELGKYEEAERWLNRAKASDKTITASQYNLGRIAFERKRFHEAASLFEEILTKDPDNVLALKAAAYTRINTGDILAAERHYSRLLILVPESSDDGYNHALVLYAMGRYSDSEKVLQRYLLSMLVNNDMQLLYARSQKAQNKTEAIDSYNTWLLNNTDAEIRSEYAQTLENHELYARALEEYRKSLAETSSAALRSKIIFSIARVHLTADSESATGVTELQNAINEGFNNADAAEELLLIKGLSSANIESIRNIINNMKRSSEI
jgi:tetratricopeptide (TPR) repeat protein